MFKFLNNVFVCISVLCLLCSCSITKCKNEVNCFDNVIITEAPALPHGRGGHIAANIGGSIIVAGGTNWSDDHTTKYWLDDSIIFRKGKWSPGLALPYPIAYAAFDSDSNSLYIAGGTNGTKQLTSAYCLASLDKNASWQNLSPLPVSVCSGAGAFLNDKFYVVCGYQNGTVSSQMWALNVCEPNAVWKKCKPLPGQARSFPAFVACGDSLYLLGGAGENSHVLPLADTYKYDPCSDTWQRLTDLPWGGYGWTASSVDKTHVLLAGRADGRIHSGIWLVDVCKMSVCKVGDAVIQTSTAPIIKVDSRASYYIGDNTWWLIGGEPDSNKNRTDKITSIRLQ